MESTISSQLRDLQNLGAVITGKNAEINDLQEAARTYLHDLRAYRVLAHFRKIFITDRNATIRTLQNNLNSVVGNLRAWKVLATVRRAVINGKNAAIHALQGRLSTQKTDFLVPLAVAYLKINAKTGIETLLRTDLAYVYGRNAILNGRWSMTRQLLQTSREDGQRLTGRLQQSGRDKFRLQRKYQAARDAGLTLLSYVVESSPFFPSTKEAIVQNLAAPRWKFPTTTRSILPLTNVMCATVAVATIPITTPLSANREERMVEDMGVPIEKLPEARSTGTTPLEDLRFASTTNDTTTNNDVLESLAGLFEGEAPSTVVATVLPLSNAAQRAEQSTTNVDSSTEEGSSCHSDSQPSSASTGLQTTIDAQEVRAEERRRKTKALESTEDKELDNSCATSVTTTDLTSLPEIGDRVDCPGEDDAEPEDEEDADDEAEPDEEEVSVVGHHDDDYEDDSIWGQWFRWLG